MDSNSHVAMAQIRKEVAKASKLAKGGITGCGYDGHFRAVQVLNI
jgi:hypothetical protein